MPSAKALPSTDHFCYDKDFDIIKKSALFADLTDEELQEALTTLHTRKKTYEKDELLLMDGEPSYVDVRT